MFSVCGYVCYHITGISNFNTTPLTFAAPPDKKKEIKLKNDGIIFYDSLFNDRYSTPS